MSASKDPKYDWASAVVNVAMSKSIDMNSLVKDAGLSAKDGDMADADLSNLDLRGQDFSGWDLRYAVFRNSLVSGAKFTEAEISAEAIIEAKDWFQADLSFNLFAQAQFLSLRRMDISSVDVLKSVTAVLRQNGINIIEDILRLSTGELERRLGRKTFISLVNRLLKIRISPMEISPHDSEQPYEAQLRKDHDSKLVMLIDDGTGDDNDFVSYMSFMHPVEKQFRSNRGGSTDIHDVDVVMITMRSGRSRD